MKSRSLHLTILSWIVLADYLAQIPYAIHLYHGIPFAGALVLGLTFLIFIIPYLMLRKDIRGGWIGMMGFLSIEFIFYFLNFIGSLMHGYMPFFQLANPDHLLAIIFGIGYLNLIASLYFLCYFLRNRSSFR